MALPLWTKTLDNYKVELLPVDPGDSAIVLSAAQSHLVDCLLARHEIVPTTLTPRLDLSEVAFRKHCGCGHAYCLQEWLLLRSPGLQADEVECLELRDCVVCGSTLAVVLFSDGRRKP